jgi:hypothetical protein
MPVRLPKSGLIPRDPKTLCSDISIYLLLLSTRTTQSIPYVHPLPVSFENKKVKENWLNYLPNSDYRDTMQRFLRARQTTRNVKLVFFSTPTASWVGQTMKTWNSTPWHCWGCAIIRCGGSGYALVIWDCDPKVVESPRTAEDYLHCSQRSFLRLLKKDRPIRQVWVHRDLKYSGQDRCLYFTLQWITHLVSLGDLEFKNNHDRRVHGCIRVA